MNFIASAHHTKHFLRGVAFLFLNKKLPVALKLQVVQVYSIQLALTIVFVPFYCEDRVILQ